MKRGPSLARNRRTSSGTKSTPRAISIFSSAWAGRKRQSLAGAPASVTPKARWIFLHDLRSRVIGQPEISTHGFPPLPHGDPRRLRRRPSNGVIEKTYSETHLEKEAQGRYSPTAVVAVSKEVAT